MKQDITETAMAELICTRLSHDIIGNIGAVANAVELLEEGDMDFMDDIKSILKTSSGVLAARLKFFRLAFGLDNANLDKLDLVKDTLNDYLATIGNRANPVELEFSLNDSKYTKAVMLAVMIEADTLIRGGKITIKHQDGKIAVLSESTLPPSPDKISQIKNILSGNDSELNAQFAPIFYLILLLKKANINLYILNSATLGFLFA